MQSVLQIINTYLLHLASIAVSTCRDVVYNRLQSNHTTMHICTHRNMVFSSHFLSKIARDGIDSADMWYRKVSKSMQHPEHVHVYSLKFNNRLQYSMLTFY